MVSPGRRLCLVVWTLIWAVVLPSGPGAEAGELTPAQKAFLKTRGPVTFVSQTHYPPFEFIGKDGDHTGMSIELIRWIATEFGFKAHFTSTTFKQAQEDLLSGRADVLTSFFYSKNRDKLFDFTPTLFEVPAYIFVQATRPDIKSIQDLAGKVVAIQKGDYAKEFMEGKKIACEFRYTENFAQATDLVAQGTADAIIGDEQIVLYHLFSTHLTDQIKRVGAPLYIGQNCMGFKDPGGILLEIMNAGIDKAFQEGVLDQIHKKWLGTTYSEAPSRAQQLFPVVLVFLLAISFLSFSVWIWNAKLRREVAARTTDLARSEQTLRTILEASPLGIGLTDSRIIKWYNPAMGRMLGYHLQEMIGQDVARIYPENHYAAIRKEVARKLAGNDTDSMDTLWVRKDGSRFDCRVRFAPLNLEGRMMSIAIAEDITAHKNADNQIKASLKEKELLLREIHHRVKNNMQVISSLLSLQEEKITPDNALLAFKDSQFRIQSIALVHEILYDSDTLSRIPLSTYLEALVRNIRPVFAPVNCSLGIRDDSRDIALPMDQAVPVGLIATELLTNAMKYGPVKDRTLEIRIAIRLASGPAIQMEICDNGPGIDPDLNVETLDSLGLKLVKGLVEEQLEGQLHLTGAAGQGTCWTVEWPFSETWG